MLVGRPILIYGSSGRYELDVIDVYQQNMHEQIIATSMLIKKLPMSEIIGDIPDTKCILMGMDLRINN